MNRFERSTRKISSYEIDKVLKTLDAAKRELEKVGDFDNSSKIDEIIYKYWVKQR